mmetsp:Transcript_19175/g.41664  ORF Transcript_19175/g.41664 Transcript_19175/m.41664 type:complete len:237 (-) Transcript_19175:525-1235(-)
MIFVSHGVYIEIGTGTGKTDGILLVRKGSGIFGKANSMVPKGFQFMIFSLECPVDDGCCRNDVGLRVMVIKDRVVPDLVGDHVQKCLHSVWYRSQRSHSNSKFSRPSSPPAFHIEYHVIWPVSVLLDYSMTTVLLNISLEAIDFVQEGFLSVLDPFFSHVSGPTILEFFPGRFWDLDVIVFVSCLQLRHLFEHSCLVFKVALGLFKLPLLLGNRIFGIGGVLQQYRTFAFLELNSL